MCEFFLLMMLPASSTFVIYMSYNNCITHICCILVLRWLRAAAVCRRARGSCIMLALAGCDRANTVDPCCQEFAQQERERERNKYMFYRGLESGCATEQDPGA